MNIRTINYLFKTDIPEMEALLDMDFPVDGHEPDESGIIAILKDGVFDNAGFPEEMQVRLRNDKVYVDFRIVDLIAMAQYGYKKWKEST